jgi:hypothetical protein
MDAVLKMSTLSPRDKFDRINGGYQATAGSSKAKEYLLKFGISLDDAYLSGQHQIPARQLPPPRVECKSQNPNLKLITTQTEARKFVPTI